MEVRVKTVVLDHGPKFDPNLQEEVNAFISGVEEVAAPGLGASAPRVVAVYVAIEKTHDDSSLATIILGIN